MKIDSAVVRARMAGENEGDTGPVDGAVVADRKVAPVQDVGARVEVEGGSARYFDPPAINARRNGFGLFSIHPIAGSLAPAIGGAFETGIWVGDRRGVGRQIVRRRQDGAGC